jgi:hypothetical protein
VYEDKLPGNSSAIADGSRFDNLAALHRAADEKAILTRHLKNK